MERSNSEVYTARIRFSCAPEDIILVNSIFDSYGGLGLIRTVDKKDCNCAIFSTNGVYKTALDVLNSLVCDGLSIKNITVDFFENVDEFSDAV